MYTDVAEHGGQIGPAIADPVTCLIVVPSLGRAGAETQAVNLANGLAAKGHTVHLTSFEQKLYQRERLVPEVRFHHIRRRSKYDLSIVRRIAEVIDREEVDIVQGVLQFATLIGSLAAKRSERRPPVVAAVHTTLSRGPKQELYDRLLYRAMLRRVPTIVFVCEYQRQHWIRKYPELERSSTVVHNGIAPEYFRKEDHVDAGQRLREDLGIPESAFVFSSIAAFRPEKGHNLILEAFGRMRGDVYLVFAGDGALKDAVQTQAADRGLEARTRFLGNIPDTRPLISASDATLLASTAVETFSMAMLESMAMGVPMIAPRIGGLPEAIIDRETGLLFPVADTDALTRCMQSVVDQPDLLRQLGRQAEEKVKYDFTLDSMVAGMETVFLRTVQARNARS